LTRLSFFGGLYIFERGGRLLYHEVFPERIGALGVMPASRGGTETLLVGGEDKIWQYSVPP